MGITPVAIRAGRARRTTLAQGSAYTQSRIQFCERRRDRLMRAFEVPRVDPQAVASFGLANFQSRTGLISIGSSASLWNKDMLAQTGMFAKKPGFGFLDSPRMQERGLVNNDTESLEVQPQQAVESYDQMKAFYDLPIAKTFLAKPGIFATGGVLVDRDWSMLANLAFIDGASASGKEFQLLVPNRPLVELVEKQFNLLWDDRERRPKVTGFELMLLAFAKAQQADLGENAPILLKTLPSLSTEAMEQAVVLYTDLKDKPPAYAKDALREVLSEVEEAP